MGSKINSFHVSAEISFELIILGKYTALNFIRLPQEKLFIPDPINVLLAHANLPSMLPYKNYQGHIPLL